MSAPQPKFFYFPIKGRGELARLVFHYGGVSFQDEHVADFMKLKPTLPLGQLPVLEVDGVIYSQSMAITRYAAKLGGLYPSDAVEALKVDMASCTLSDLDVSVMDIMFHTADETVKADKIKVLLEEALPKAFCALEKLVSGKYFLGDKTSYVDLQLYDVVENKVKTFSPALDLKAYAKLAGVIQSVSVDPKISDYLAKS